MTVRASFESAACRASACAAARAIAPAPVGAGNAGTPSSGGYQAISPNGRNQWYVQETNPGTDPVPHSSVQASLTVGAYAGGYGVEGGSLGQNTYALGASNGAMPRAEYPPSPRRAAAQLPSAWPR